ncbi:hypothetical protein CAI21_01480 [Alkalilimnicola ehrlichii]|uniref:Phage tail assembly chaperone-like domain-containing protein n=1 Tax=Alkalilimnicola ehrlichii TaxID=351052 RepID=A0A3E0X173_9GAMM|nr:tail fiber assembly protein [Alkalilimnicola ehrlichii]RFA31327.1 hypothetical protein CAI21_01480 [Alkalilimnicola ehrlichii]RFA39399.1 hypothetical protein CAL65_00930 [Alkalilimnicola ehrlichii]
MQRFDAIKDDNTVGVDGVFLHVNLDFLPDEIWSVHSQDGQPDIYYRDVWKHVYEDPDNLVGQCLDAWNAEKARLEQERKQAEQAWLNSWERIRAERDDRMRETDWMVLPDAPLTPAQQAAVKQYRQSLRDVPQAFKEPLEVVWPDQPEEVTAYL